MLDDPTETRRRGVRRVRLVTAWLAGVTVVGTGAAALAVASSDPAAAGQAGSTSPVQPGGEGAIRPGGSDTSGLDFPSPDSGLQPPARPLGRGSGHSGHASSGGS